MRPEPATRLLNCKLDEGRRSKLARLAAAVGRSQSALVRQALDDLFAKLESDEDIRKLVEERARIEAQISEKLDAEKVVRGGLSSLRRGKRKAKRTARGNKHGTRRREPRLAAGTGHKPVNP